LSDTSANSSLRVDPVEDLRNDSDLIEFDMERDMEATPGKTYFQFQFCKILNVGTFHVKTPKDGTMGLRI
jgi:hypothetical protein